MEVAQSERMIAASKMQAEGHVDFFAEQFLLVAAQTKPVSLEVGFNSLDASLMNSFKQLLFVDSARSFLLLEFLIV
jgi:hypothetical protein